MSLRPRLRSRPRRVADNLELRFDLTIPDFVAKWQGATLSERAGAHSHFIDLCSSLGQQSPTEIDCDGSTYTFEKQVEKNCGGDGFADVWKNGFFAWEYKRKGKSLADAYQQLLKYREALKNPPLLVVCDFDTFEVHTNWTNTSPEVYRFQLQDLLLNKKTDSCKFPPQEVLHALFTDPQKLEPGETRAQVTKRAASEFAELAENLRHRGVPPEQAAHFVMRLLFCLFAEDIGLLPNRLFSRVIEANRKKPAEFRKKLRHLFEAMAHGGSFGADDVPYFDGGLFMDDHTCDLAINDLTVLSRAGKLNWASIEPAIFGTLFERILDPESRLGVGAKYTGVEDIELIIEPVLMRPLRRKWEGVRQQAGQIIASSVTQPKAKRRKAFEAAESLLRGFVASLTSVRVLDPACGSGNFLYLALKHLLELEKEVSIFAWDNGLSGLFIQCRPSQLYGIESNVYALKIASVAVWIGYLQWQQQSGMPIDNHPIMQPLENIRLMDAVLCHDEDGLPTEPEWPDAEVIIGNPPFLGDKKMRESLGHKYVEELRGVYSDRLPGGSDLVCYWFEKARAMVQSGHTKRVGLLATQAIRGGTNRRVLERIKTSGDIFWAQSDRNWVLDGADVHVSMIGFDNGEEQSRELDGKPVVQINADLSSSASDLTQAKVLNQNRGIAFIGTQKGGSFDLDENVASTMLGKTGNPNGRPNSEVIKPWINGSDLTGKTRGKWIIDFGISLSRREAAQYEAPFEHVQKYVYPSRKNLRREGHRTKWWIHAESRPGMRYALGGKTRFIVTTRHSKHRIFNWEPIGIVPDSALVVFARDDDYFFGVLQSSVHELWARRKGTQVRDVESGFRYTPTSTFETFPMPWSAGHEPDNDELNNIATAACQLVKKRDRWLNPPGALAEELRKRTLTGLYNESPTWLKDAHHELNEAVFAAYGWPNDLSDDAILTRLLQLNTTRHADEQGRIVPAQPEEPAIAAVPKKLVGSATEEKRPRPRKARRASKSVRRQVS